MRLRTLVLAIVAVLPLLICASCSIGLNSSAPSPAPTELDFDSRLRHSLDLNADLLTFEQPYCLYGGVSGDEAVVKSNSLANMITTAADSVQYWDCDPKPLAFWHNHPYNGLDTDFIGCALSDIDIESALRTEIPFQVVQLANDNICWFTLEQIQKYVDAHNGEIPSLMNAIREQAEDPVFSNNTRENNNAHTRYDFGLVGDDPHGGGTSD